jgi:hypothetical protein
MEVVHFLLHLVSPLKNKAERHKANIIYSFSFLNKYSKDNKGNNKIKNEATSRALQPSNLTAKWPGYQ